MSSIGTRFKAPGDQIDFDVSFENWITDDDTISTATATVTPTGELTVSSVQIASPDVKVWVAGGADGETYEVKVTASTTAGRIKETCFNIRVKDC